MGYVDITVRVPESDGAVWIEAIRNAQESGVYIKDGHFSDSCDDEALLYSCDIVKIKESSQVFDPECVRNVLNTVKDVLTTGATIVNAISSATPVKANS